MLSRRQLLRQSVTVVTAGMTMPPIFTRAIHLAHNGNMALPKPGERVLVVVQMAGGNDGLNTIVPYTNGAYYDLRRGLSLSENEVIPLDDQFAFHPSLAALKPLWDKGLLAIVHGAGYPNPNLSHFRSMEIWQTAKPDEPKQLGWLGRYFDRLVDQGGHLIEGLAVGATLPDAFLSNMVPVPAVQSLEAYQIQPDPGDPLDMGLRAEMLLQLYHQYRNASPYAALLDGVAADAVTSSNALKRAAAAYAPAAEYPQSRIAQGLKLTAQVLTSDLGVRVAHVGQGGYDTHSNQKPDQARLLKELADALAAFYADLEAHGIADKVTIMTWSEFGRRVTDNASAGTDHGTAGPMFVLGGRVKGGHVGEPVSLADLDKGNLKYTTDFRSVYATLLEEWLGTPADEVLGVTMPRLPLFRSTA
jgi:uncharacterized protein (DUF1501 family)